jgi:hypothetical protein
MGMPTKGIALPKLLLAAARLRGDLPLGISMPSIGM